MIWLSRTETLKYWILFTLKNGKFTPVLCDQVTQCLSSLTISHVSATSTNNVPMIGGKRIMDRT